MSTTPKRFDIWFVKANTVLKEVPYEIATNYLQTGRITAEDRVRAEGTKDWILVKKMDLLSAYLPRTVEAKVFDESDAIEPLELEIPWKKGHGEEDDDVDMIPLIDISMVLLIFFMMTTTVASISRIKVPDVSNAFKVDSNPGTITVQIDLLSDERIEYALGLGAAAPTPDSDHLTESQLFSRLDEQFKAMGTHSAKVRIAAHRDLTYETVNQILKGIETRKRSGVLIDDITVETGQKR